MTHRMCAEEINLWIILARPNHLQYILLLAKLTFYTAIICPYAQRAAITLQEVGADYEKVEIDLANKPDW